MNDLIAAFDDYFEVIPASTPELREEAFRLRYQVYCEEVKIPGFESWRFLHGLEMDEYDARSAHYLMRHRPSGKIAGTVRLVLADPYDPGQPFPIEKFSGPHFDPALIDPAKLPRRHTAEISRLILARDFRSRQGEYRSPYGVSDTSQPNVWSERRHFPHPILGLFVAIYRIAAERGITHLYAYVEPALNRMLKRFELNLMAIGPVVDCHGARQPCLGIVNEMLIRIYERRREVWELVTDHGKVWSHCG